MGPSKTLSEREMNEILYSPYSIKNLNKPILQIYSNCNSSIAFFNRSDFASYGETDDQQTNKAQNRRVKTQNSLGSFSNLLLYQSCYAKEMKWE